MERKIKEKVTGFRTRDGAGVSLVRVLGHDTVETFDPILMLDSFDSERPDDYTAGFPLHPHRGIETISLIVSGNMVHRDSLGNEERLYAGDIQYLSAGSGIFHSEKNESDAPVHLIQTWIMPSAKGLTPQYGSYAYDAKKRQNLWQHLFGSEKTDALIHFYQDANVYASIHDKNFKSTLVLSEGRQAYVKVMKGEVRLNAQHLRQGDAAEVVGESLEFEALEEAHLLVIEMQAE